MGRTGLSRRELSRVEVMGRVRARSLRLREGAELLEVSYRQAKRIWARYRAGGAKALQHGNCGRVSNRAYAGKFRAAVLQQVQARYADFGHLSTKLCLRLHSCSSLETGLKHGIELVKHGTDGPARSFPSALLQRGDSQAKLQL